MHPKNMQFWRMAAERFPSYFSGDGLRVLEVGSQFVNGSIREVFGDCGEYIGVDWRAGKNVDVVCLASQMSFDSRFHTVASASMLEHDPEWQMSIANMVSQMRDDGMIALSWGAARNSPHCLETAYDGKFHCLPAGRVLTLLEHLGVFVAFFRYEGRLDVKTSEPLRSTDPGMGEVCLIGFKDEQLADGVYEVDELLGVDNERWNE